jgi:hypothetical protein
MTALLLACLTAFAASPVERAQQAQLERARAQLAGEVQLAAFDLIDELVVRLREDPVFAEPTPVVVAHVGVPVGLGAGMQAMLENHLANVLIHNPEAHLQLVHCPQCTAVVVHSGPEGTVVSRGIDHPDALKALGPDTSQHALFLDVEAEGTFLVLRARLTRLSDERPIVWSHTLASSTSTPSMLRVPTQLVTAEEAHDAYLDVLRDRGTVDVPLRFGVRTYARPDSGGIAAPPFVWLQSGVEIGTTPARVWTASLLAGYSFIPQAYQGIMGQARVHRLITGQARSQVRPDLYAFVGAAAVSVWGPATGSFSDEVVTADEIITALEGDGPRTSFGTLQVGLDLRVGQRIGLSTFLESIPDYTFSPNFGRYVQAGLSFQSFGTEVTFWF